MTDRPRQTLQGWLIQRAREREDQAVRNAVAMHRVAAAAARGPAGARGPAATGSVGLLPAGTSAVQRRPAGAWQRPR